MSDVIEARELTKRYRDGSRTIDAVSSVTLAIGAGTLTVVRGPSGSGKSTLLGLVGGMIAPTSGRVTVLGTELTHLRDHHRTAYRRAHIGFVFQELALIDGMSVRENLLLPLVPLGGARREHTDRAKALLERMGLADRIDSRPERLSGGEKQRAAIARALVLAPKVLVLDEPTAHLDTENALEVVRLLAELRDEGTTVIAATHDPRLADDPRVDRALGMRDGRLA